MTLDSLVLPGPERRNEQDQGQGWKADAATKFYGVMRNDVMPRLKRLEHALEHTASRCANELPKTFKNATDEACQAFPNNS